MKPMVARRRAFYFYSFIVLFIIAIPFIILYSLGYSLTDNYTLTERGGVYVFVSESGSEIFIDNEHKKTTSTFQKELFVQNLKPKTYLVLVANDEFWPWAKYVEIREKQVSPLFPFLVPRTIETREIVRATTTATSSSRTANREYEEISLLFEEVEPTIESATTTPAMNAIVKRKMKVWNDEQKVFAEWMGSEGRIPPYFCTGELCNPILEVFDATDEIRNVEFYPGRDDAIIVALADGVYAMEIDTRQFHNFYPLYKGKSPDFRVDGDNIYIKDGEYIAELMDL